MHEWRFWSKVSKSHATYGFCRLTHYTRARPRILSSPVSLSRFPFPIVQRCILSHDLPYFYLIPIAIKSDCRLSLPQQILHTGLLLFITPCSCSGSLLCHIVHSSALGFYVGPKIYYKICNFFERFL